VRRIVLAIRRLCFNRRAGRDRFGTLRPTTISRQELTAVYEFWWVKHLNDQLFHVISGCGINSNDYRRHMVALTRMDQIRNCLGEDVAKEAVKEFMERFWAKEDPELRIAYESGDYEEYWAKHLVECGYSVAPCKT